MLPDKNETGTFGGGPVDRKSNRAGKRICLSRASVCEPGNSASRPEVPDPFLPKSVSGCPVGSADGNCRGLNAGRFVTLAAGGQATAPRVCGYQGNGLTATGT